jgi:drug/metabolite transporter (DMT)-like permease
LSFLDRKLKKSPDFLFKRLAVTDRKNSCFKFQIILAFAAIYIVWGTTYLAIRFAIETIPPLFMMGSRLFIAGGALYVWARLRGEEPPQKSHWGTAFFLGLLLFTVGHGTLVWSEQFISSGIAALICAMSPIWITLLQKFVYNENPLTGKVIIGLIAGLCSVWLLAGSFGLLGGSSVNLKNVAILMFGTLSWSIGAVFSKKAHLPRSSIMAAGMNLITGGGSLLCLSFFTGESISLPSITLRSLGSIVYLIVFGSIIAFTSYFWLLRRISPSKVSTHAYVNPVVAVLVGWFAGGELLSPRILLAAFLMVMGVAAIVTRNSKPFFTLKRRFPKKETPEPKFLKGTFYALIEYMKGIKL